MLHTNRVLHSKDIFATCVFHIIVYINYIIQNIRVLALACYLWESSPKITEPKFFCKGNLDCFVIVELLDHPAAFCISFILRPALFTLIVEEILVEWAGDTVMSILASSMNILIYLAFAAVEIGLCGGAYDIMNCSSFPVE